MSKKQGYCDKCGSWSDHLTQVYSALVRLNENYCEKCVGKK